MKNFEDKAGETALPPQRSRADELYELYLGDSEKTMYFITHNDIPVRAYSDGKGNIEVKNVLTGGNYSLAEASRRSELVSEEEFNQFLSSI
jgi:hypothetical protein